MPISVTGLPLRRLVVPLRALVRGVLVQEGRRTGEITVVLAGDDELRALNRRWRRIDRATDVISFAYDEHEPDADTRPVNGDLVLSMDRMREQSKRYRVSGGAELARLVIHGALHLCGHDHQKDEERRLMRGREERCLHALRAVVARLDAALDPGAPRPRAAAKPARSAPAKRAATTRRKRAVAGPAKRRSPARSRTASAARRARPARRSR